jgi:cell wall assembly regulator SMI1/ankyrin repeat protein
MLAKPPKWDDAFTTACEKSDLIALKRALDLGMPLNQPIKHFDGATALQRALGQGARAEAVQALLAAGADVNLVPGQTISPLHIAATMGRPDLVNLLLTAGADVHARNELGWTALTRACMEKGTGYEEVVQRLLDAGAKATVDDLDIACEAGDGLEPASRLGSPALVRILVAAGVDVNGISHWGGTALHRAAEHGNPELVETLLALGADPNLRLAADNEDYPNQTPLEVARDAKTKKVIPLLEAAVGGQLPPPKPAKPKPVSVKIPDLWRRLETALATAAPQIKKSLRKGATETRLVKLELALGGKLPAEVRSSYLLHDGQADDADCLFPEGFAELDCDYLLMPLAEVLGEWEMWKELVEEGEFEDETATPDEGVRADWWNIGWVPLAGNGAGDLLCIDLKPARGGRRGQVVRMSHESGERYLLAGSLGEFLVQLCEHYEER